ncbi:MAG: hypothetical protein Q9167_004920 [Letrouitia subvulpina]
MHSAWMLVALATLILWITLSGSNPIEETISKDSFAKRQSLVEYPNAGSLNATMTSEPQTSFLPSAEVRIITITVPDSPFVLVIMLSPETAFTSLFAPLFSAVDTEIARQVHEHGYQTLVPPTFRVRGPAHEPFFLELVVTALAGFRLQWDGMAAVMRGLRILIEVRQRGLNKVFVFMIWHGRRLFARGQVERLRAPMAVNME